MAEVANKHPENVAGPYYIDSLCIDCGLCQATAPDNFARSDNGYSFVSKQPTTPDEESLTQRAKDECPTQAIGSDGK